MAMAREPVVQKPLDGIVSPSTLRLTSLILRCGHGFVDAQQELNRLKRGAIGCGKLSSAAPRRRPE
jgi:hypothetical protein